MNHDPQQLHAVFQPIHLYIKFFKMADMIEYKHVVLHMLWSVVYKMVIRLCTRNCSS